MSHDCKTANRQRSPSDRFMDLLVSHFEVDVIQRGGRGRRTRGSGRERSSRSLPYSGNKRGGTDVVRAVPWRARTSIDWYRSSTEILDWPWSIRRPSRRATPSPPSPHPPLRVRVYTRDESSIYFSRGDLFVGASIYFGASTRDSGKLFGGADKPLTPHPLTRSRDHDRVAF